MQHGKWTLFLLTSIRGLHYGCPENSWLCRAELSQFQAPRTSFPGPTALQMGRQPPAGLTGLRNRGAGQKGYGELFSPHSVWLLMHAACRGREGNWPTLPPFISSLVCFYRQDKEGMGGGGWELFILIQFLATESYKNIQRYFTHYQFATVFPSSHCHCPPFPRSSTETFEKTMYGYMMTFVSYLQSVFPKEGVFHILRLDKNTIQSLCASQWP